MPAGLGKYDDLVTLVREKSEAGAVVLVVAGGNRGDGFSIQLTDPRYFAQLVSALRKVADSIERQGAMFTISVAKKKD